MPLGINRTFQVPKPFRAMTVYENVQVALHFGAHVARADEDAAVRAVLSDIALEDHAAGARVGSDGQSAEAAGSRTRACDEPEAAAGGRDRRRTQSRKSSAMIADLLLKLAKRGIAMIVVEHLLDFLNRITNRVMVLGAGRVLFEGTLADASRNPDVVAAFIGG